MPFHPLFFEENMMFKILLVLVSISLCTNIYGQVSNVKGKTTARWHQVGASPDGPWIAQVYLKDDPRPFAVEVNANEKTGFPTYFADRSCPKSNATERVAWNGGNDFAPLVHCDGHVEERSTIPALLERGMSSLPLPIRQKMRRIQASNLQ